MSPVPFYGLLVHYQVAAHSLSCNSHRVTVLRELLSVTPVAVLPTGKLHIRARCSTLHAPKCAALRGTPTQVFIDPRVNLAAETRSLRPYSWVLPLEER